MTRRIAGLTAAAVVAVATGLLALNGNPAAAQVKQTEHGLHHANQEGLERCAKACDDCQRACDMCAAHCIHMVADGKKEHVKTLQSCQDCAGICSEAARVVARGGPFTDLACQACAEACARCGKQCEPFSEDRMMKTCLEECRRCEKECREMLKHLGKVEAK